MLSKACSGWCKVSHGRLVKTLLVILNIELSCWHSECPELYEHCGCINSFCLLMQHSFQEREYSEAKRIQKNTIMLNENSVTLDVRGPTIKLWLSEGPSSSFGCQRAHHQALAVREPSGDRARFSWEVERKTLLKS